MAAGSCALPRDGVCRAQLQPFLVGSTTALGGCRPSPHCPGKGTAFGAEDGLHGCEAGVSVQAMVRRLCLHGAEGTAGLQVCTGGGARGEAWGA